jgi:putative endonuclease
MTSNRTIGQAGESAAADYLQRTGYIIVDKNYRTRMGEIDIIAYDGPVLAFIEVKSRRSMRFGTPAEAVSLRKQRKLIALALQYISNKKPSYKSMRFDVVEVVLENGRVKEVCLIKDAFQSIGRIY